MLLYVHVPFCRQKCLYCAFYSTTPPETRLPVILDSYVQTLRQEMRQWSERLSRPKVRTVFFGGGTPSLLPGRAVQELLQDMQSLFRLADDAEISMEANPESSLAPGWLDAVRAAGVNRLSLGIQSFSDDELALLGRVHTATAAKEAVRAARAAGFNTVSFDLMWGLPGQSLKSWQSQLEMAAELDPDHISAYGLTLEPDRPLTEAVLSGRLHLPEEETQTAMYRFTVERLGQAGLEQYEISNFAKPGCRCRHNLGYWAGEDYLGLGAGATSTINCRRWTNPEDMRAWQSAVEKQLEAKAEELTPAIRAKELLMLSLRTTKGLSLADWRACTSDDLPEPTVALCSALQAAKLVELSSDRLKLTPRGMLLSNLVLERLFQTLPD